MHTADCVYKLETWNSNSDRVAVAAYNHCRYEVVNKASKTL